MSNKTWTLVAAILGSGIVFLDSSVLPVALTAIGREPRLFVEVLEGLSVGERIAVSGTFLIDSESRIRTIAPDLSARP